MGTCRGERPEERRGDRREERGGERERERELAFAALPGISHIPPSRFLCSPSSPAFHLLSLFAASFPAAPPAALTRCAMPRRSPTTVSPVFAFGLVSCSSHCCASRSVFLFFRCVCVLRARGLEAAPREPRRVAFSASARCNARCQGRRRDDGVVNEHSTTKRLPKGGAHRKRDQRDERTGSAAKAGEKKKKRAQHEGYRGKRSRRDGRKNRAETPRNKQRNLRRQAGRPLCREGRAVGGAGGEEVLERGEPRSPHPFSRPSRLFSRRSLLEPSEDALVDEERDGALRRDACEVWRKAAVKAPDALAPGRVARGGHQPRVAPLHRRVAGKLLHA